MTHNKMSSRAKIRLGRVGRTSRARNRARRGRLVFESLEHRNLLAGDLFSSIEPNGLDSPLGFDQVLTTMSAGESSWATAEGEWAPEGEDAPDLVAFAKALTDAGVKLYSAAWCTFCTAQKQLFQDGGSYLPYIEVSNPDRTLNEVGIENNITSFPTWEFPDLTRATGLLDLQTISQRSGVSIPTSSIPYIKPIENKTLLAGSPLHIVLDGYDPNGDPLTYTVTSDNPQVSATLLQGNPGMRIDFAEYGDMVFQLFQQRASRPVGRVIELATSGFYDGIIFHRVIEGFVIQGGDPTGTGSGGSTLGTFDDQYHVDLQHNQAGLLSYAKSSDDTNDSQFFVTLAPTRHLDFNHSIFGILVEGMDVLQAIGGTATTAGDRPVYDVRMNTIEIFQDNENAVMMLKADPAAVGQQANITVTVNDGTGNQVLETFQVTVAADLYNGGPFLEDIPDFQTTAGTPLQIQLSAIDVEGDPVYYDAASSGSVNSTVQVDSETGLVTVTPPPGYVGPMQIMVGVQALNGSDRSDPWDTQIVNINVVSGLLELELLPESDSNIVGDNVTNVTEMTFRVSNTSAGGLVQILYDGAVIGQGTAPGTSIDITTDNLAALGDGTYALTAVQTVGGVTGDPSNVLTVTLDTTPPVPLTSTPPTAATTGIQVVYDAEHPEEGTTGFRYALAGAPSGAVIDPVTGVMRWTPTTSQGGVNTFQIVASDLAGNTQTQNLAIDVTVVTQQVLIELVVTDSQQNPITELSSGEEFLVLAYVQDIRALAQGVFAAYVDVRYDPALVSSLVTSISDVTFGDVYQNGKSGFFTTPGLLDEVGAFANIFSPIGGGKYLLFAVPFRAEEAGEVTFTLEPATETGREVLLFEQNIPVAPNAITFVNATLTVDSSLSAQPDLFNVDEDSVNFPLDVLSNDTNETGSPVTIIQVGPTSHSGTVTIAADGQRILYTPFANFFGEETFWYTIAAGGLTSTATVTVQVAPVNDPPTAVDDQFSVGLNSEGNFLDVLANDQFAPDQGEVLRVVRVGPTSHGGTVVIAPNGTHLLYTPASGFSGDETFSYTIRDRAITDPTGLESTAVVRINVESVPRPTAVNDTATVNEDSVANSIDVLENDLPVESGATLTVVAVTQSKFGGTVTIAAGGTHVLYTPAPDFFGEDTFTYTVEEEDGGRATASVTVTVLNVNDPPTANDDSYQISKGSTTRTLNVLENDTILPDVGEVLTIVAVTQGSRGGTVQIAADGKSILYTPSPDPALPDTYTETFTYTIDDGSGADNSTDTATVTIQIRPYTSRDLGGIVPYAATRFGVGGLMVSLSGMDQFNGSVSMSDLTVAKGRYNFSDLAPGSYQIQTNSAPFLVLSSTVLNVDSADEDGDNLDLNFPAATRDPSTIGIADFLARAPGQSSLSPADSVLVAAHTGDQQHWYSYQAGWQGYTQLEVELSADASLLSVIAVASSGQLYQGTVAMNNAAYVKRLANAGDSHLIRIDAGPEQLGLQPVPTAPVVTVTPLITNSTTPQITGTVSDGTLQVTVGGRTYVAGDGNLSVSNTTWSLQIPAAHALAEGTYNVAASATNAAGGVGSDGTTNELVVDTTPPVVTVAPLTTSNPTPSVTGTISDGTLRVIVNNRTYTAGDGNLTVVGTHWTLNIPAAHALPSGTYDVAASSTDTAGNVGTDATTGELVIDTSLPVVTVNPLVTNSTTPTITGTVSEGTLQVTVGGQTYVAEDGNLSVSNSSWSLQIPAAHALAEGTYNVTASATNALGNVGTDGTTDELIVDTTPPTVTVTPLTTSNPTPTVTGTVSDGTLNVTVNNRTYSPGDGNLTVVGTNWTLNIPAAHALPSGTYNVAASSTDAAGNVGTDATTGELVIDTSLPVVTVNPLVTSDTTPLITGTVSEGTLQVTVAGRTYVVGDGNLSVSNSSWSLQIPAAHALAEGTYSVTASATNSLGNVGSDGTTDELIVDTTPPAVTVNPLTTFDTTPVIIGSVSDGMLQVIVDGQNYLSGDGNLIVNGTNWMLQIPAEHALADGVYTVTATSVDAAGNVGLAPGTGHIVIDTTMSLVTVHPLITNDTTPTITGTIHPTVSSDWLMVYVNEQMYVEADGHLTVADGNWALQIPEDQTLAEGTYTITALVGDITPIDSDEQELVIDLTPPVVTVESLMTNDPMPLVHGTVSDGTLTVTVNDRTYSVGDGHLSLDGQQWTLQIPAEDALAEGMYLVIASAVDTAGNLGAADPSGQLVVDMTPPVVTVNALSTAVSTPVITGTVDDGTVTVTLNSQTYSVGDGHLSLVGQQWALQVPEEHALADGVYDVTASAVDQAGNQGEDLTSDELVIDPTLPLVTVTPLVTNTATPTITGTVSHGTLQVVVNGQTYVDGDGLLTVVGTDWTLHIPAEDALAEGVYTVSASATEGVDRLGSDATIDELVIDLTPPVVTVEPLTTSNPTPVVTGSVSDGSLLVTIAGQTYTAGDGDLQVVGTDWILQIPVSHALDLGTYTVTAIAEDTAGNLGTDLNTDQLVIVAEEPAGEGEGFDLLWSDDDFLEDIQQTALQDLPASDDAYAHAVDRVLASSG